MTGCRHWIGLPPLSLLPMALAAFYVLHLYVESGVSVFAVLRALIVAVGIGLVVWIAASALLGDRGKGTVVAVFVIFGVVAWQNLLQLAVAGALVLVVTALLPRLMRIRFPWALVIPAGNGLALMLMLALVIRAGQNGTLAQLPEDIAWAVAGAFRTQAAAAPADAPDIYIVMLEDYPRADVLERLFGFDNAQFLSALADRGFIVSPKARSNYSNTELTLLTMFQARHIEAIPELDQLRNGRGDLYPRLRDLTNSGVVFDILRRHGYEVMAASSGFEQISLRGADRFFDAGQLNDFELTLMRVTLAAPLTDKFAPGLLGSQQRQRIGDEFAFLSEVARESQDRPKLVFVHIPAPHTPIVFGPQGEPVDASIADPYRYDLSDLAQFRSLYIGQLRYLNQLAIDAVDELPSGGRPTITILLTDEGLGQFLEQNLQAGPIDLVAMLFAARAPGHEDLFGPAITPVNVFPIILDRYLGENLPRQSDRNFISGSAAPFDGFEMPNTDAGAAAP